MAKGKIGVQMSTVAPKIREVGVYSVMEQIAGIGYRCAEISQVEMNKENVQLFQKAQRELGMSYAALSAALENSPGREQENLTDHFDKIVEDCQTLDTTFLRIGMLPVQYMSDKDQALEFIKRADEMAERLEEHGIKLYYHNHHVEFAKYDGEYLMDIMLRQSRKLGFELDCHWIHRGGENPVTYIPKFKGRVDLLHLKDYRISRLDLTADDFKDMSKFRDKFNGVVEFAEVGEGNLPMQEIIEVGLEAGSRFFLVEQDQTYGRDPIESLDISARNLRDMGYADWF